MASTGFTAVTLAVNQNSGTDAWAGPTNVYASDNAYATMADSVTVQTTDRLYASMDANAFTIPTGAAIQGVEVRWERATTCVVGPSDVRAQLMYNSGTIGTSKTGLSFGNGTDASQTLGGPADLWGANLNVAGVNHATFGVAFWMLFAGGEFPAGSARIDFIELNVYYTATTGAPERTRMGVGLKDNPIQRLRELLERPRYGDVVAAVRKAQAA